MDSATTAGYMPGIRRVIDLLQAELESNPSLQELASAAGYSPFHFHRIFKAVTGETLGAYIQRMRLERSANLLCLHPQEPITTILLQCGFDNPSVFSRMFRRRFGLSPNQFRRQYGSGLTQKRNPGKESSPQYLYTSDSHPEGHPIERKAVPMHVEVKTLPGFHTAYIRHLYGYSKGVHNRQINQAFERVCKWAAAHQLFRPGALTIGIPYDNPEITPNDRCRYDACVSVPLETLRGEGEIGIQDIPSGLFAVSRIELAVDQTAQIGEIVDQMYRDWLPGSGFQADDRLPLEIYYENEDKKPGTWIKMDYCIPIRPA